MGDLRSKVRKEMQQPRQKAWLRQHFLSKSSLEP